MPMFRHAALRALPGRTRRLDGASREAVAKSLHVLRELGWVETGRREITVLDRTALQSLVG